MGRRCRGNPFPEKGEKIRAQVFQHPYLPFTFMCAVLKITKENRLYFIRWKLHWIACLNQY
jgi:hypothetical protein